MIKPGNQYVFEDKGGTYKYTVISVNTVGMYEMVTYRLVDPSGKISVRAGRMESFQDCVVCGAFVRV